MSIGILWVPAWSEGEIGDLRQSQVKNVLPQGAG